MTLARGVKPKLFKPVTFVCHHVDPGIFADGGTKACMHSFTMASRYAYEKTNIRLVELVPPAVKTNLGAGNDRSHDYGVSYSTAIQQFKQPPPCCLQHAIASWCVCCAVCCTFSLQTFSDQDIPDICAEGPCSVQQSVLAVHKKVL